MKVNYKSKLNELEILKFTLWKIELTNDKVKAYVLKQKIKQLENKLQKIL